jgi:hypothetical protein
MGHPSQLKLAGVLSKIRHKLAPNERSSASNKQDWGGDKKQGPGPAEKLPVRVLIPMLVL